MTYICLFVCVWFSYAATIMLLTRGALIFVMVFTVFHAAVFCGFYALARNLNAKSPQWAFMYANVLMLGVSLVLRLIFAKIGHQSASSDGHPTWTNGVPTALGWYQEGQMAVFCVFNHSVGYGMCRLAQKLFPVLMRQTMDR